MSEPEPAPPQPPSPAVLWGLRLLAAMFVVLGIGMQIQGQVSVTSRAWQPNPDGPGEIPVVLEFAGTPLLLLSVASIIFGVGLAVIIQNNQRGLPIVLLSLVVMLAAFAVQLA